MKKILLALLSLIALSCQSQDAQYSKSSISENSRPLDNTTDLKFDSCMEILASKYATENIFTPTKPDKLHDIYTLTKRVYMPKFKNLTFDRRDFNQISHAYAHVLHIYNDTINYVLPLTDLYYLHKKAISSKPLEIAKFLNFSVELNALISILHTTNREDLNELLDILMSFERMQPINSKLEYAVFLKKAEFFQQTGGIEIRKACADDFNKSLEVIKEAFGKKDKVVYSDGVVTFIFTITEDMNMQVEILNVSCSY